MQNNNMPKNNKMAENNKMPNTSIKQIQYTTSSITTYFMNGIERAEFLQSRPPGRSI